MIKLKHITESVLPKSFWLVDFRQNKRLVQNNTEFGNKLYKDNIELIINDLNTGEHFIELLKNKTIETIGHTNFLLTGDVKFFQGLWSVIGKKMKKDFTSIKNYDELNLKDYIDDNTTGVPVDAILKL